MEGPEAYGEIVWAAVGSALRKRHTVQALQEHNDRRQESLTTALSLPGSSGWRGSTAQSPVLALRPGGPCAGLHLPHLSGSGWGKWRF